MSQEALTIEVACDDRQAEPVPCKSALINFFKQVLNFASGINYICFVPRLYHVGHHTHSY